MLLPVTLSMVAPLIAAGPRIGLRALEEAGKTLQASIFQSAVTVVGGIAGALTAGVVGAAWGLALGTGAAVLVWWILLVRALRQNARRIAAHDAREPDPVYTPRADRTRTDAPSSSPSTRP